MAFPVGLPTRRVSFGAAVIFEDGTPLAMTIEISASASLVWGPTGTPLISYTRTWTGTVGTERVMPLPTTDAEGYRTTAGEAVDVTDGKQSHYYSGRISYKLGNAEIKRAEFGPFVLPMGDGSIVDIDLLIPVTDPTGVTISLPDSWTNDIAAAREASENSAISASTAQQAALAAQAAAEVAEGAPGPEGPEGPEGPASTVPGPKGDTGPQGVSVQSVTLQSTVGRVKTYRIALTNGTNFDYTVTDGLNGTNGTNGVDGYPIVVAPEGTVAPGTLANGTLLMEY